MTDVLQVARELSERGERFALATVVWRRAPSSGKTGYRAVITASGEVRGWVGGACAEPVVVREALKPRVRQSVLGNYRVLTRGDVSTVRFGAYKRADESLSYEGIRKPGPTPPPSQGALR